MTIIKWDPYKSVKQIQEKLDSLFEARVTGSKHSEDELVHSEWTPDVDIFEDDKKIVIKADLPGVDEKKMSIKLDNSILTLQGERKFIPETNIENYRRIERSYGTFIRKFALPASVDANKIKATFNEGILEINLPKQQT